VLARPWRPRRTGKIAFAREVVELLAAAHRDRMVHAVGDAAYVGEHLRSLASGITWTSRLKVTSVLHDLAPPRTGPESRAGPAPKAPGWAPPPISLLPRCGARRACADTTTPTACRSPRSPACGSESFHTRTVRVGTQPPTRQHTNKSTPYTWPGQPPTDKRESRGISVRQARTDIFRWIANQAPIAYEDQPATLTA